MKDLVKRIATNSLSLFLASLLYSGLSITGGFSNYLILGALLAVLSAFLDPIVKIITLPFNLLSLGSLSFLTTLAALYIVTIFSPDVNVTAFTFNGISFLGLSIGKIYFSPLLSFVAISATIYFLNKVVSWFFSK